MFRFSLILFILVATIPAYTASAPSVSQLLRECNQHLKANRLTSGKGGTALSCYQEVLKIEPANTKALAGLKKIEERYIKWAKNALQKGQKDKVKRYLTSLRMVNPQSPALIELEAQLQPSSNITSPSSEPVASEPPAKSVTTSPADKSITPSKPTKSAASQPSTDKSTTPSTDELITSPPVDESATPSSISEEPPPPPRKAQVTDIGQIYELINTTECLTWPTPDTKEKGGKNGWGEFYPKKGDTGMIIKEMQHCHLEDSVYIVEIEQYYVPISSVGIKIMDEKPVSTNEVEIVDEKPASKKYSFSDK